MVIVQATVLFCFRNDDEEISADIVFIHGLQGGPFKTWRQRDSVDVEDGKNGLKQIKFWPKVIAATFFLLPLAPVTAKYQHISISSYFFITLTAQYQLLMTLL